MKSLFDLNGTPSVVLIENECIRRQIYMPPNDDASLKRFIDAALNMSMGILDKKKWLPPMLEYPMNQQVDMDLAKAYG